MGGQRGLQGCVSQIFQQHGAFFRENLLNAGHRNAYRQQVAMIPFDMGASFIGITAKELAILTGGGVVFGLAGSTLLQRGLEEHIGRQQFINFFAIACDQLALPRTIAGNDDLLRGTPQIAEKRNPGGFGIRERRWTLAELMPKNLQTLRSSLTQI